MRNETWGRLSDGTIPPSASQANVGYKPRRYVTALPKQPLLCSGVACLRRENPGGAYHGGNLWTHAHFGDETRCGQPLHDAPWIIIPTFSLSIEETEEIIQCLWIHTSYQDVSVGNRLVRVKLP